DAAIGAIHSALDRGLFKLRPSLILSLQREALAGISSYAGNYRPGGVAIEGSKHEPVAAYLVPELVEDMCDYVNDHWNESTPIHLAAYLMWRLNWIHPFADGNGRTSRIVSYVVLSIRAGSILPGTPTIPDQIVDNRKPYSGALDAADLAFLDGKIDVSKMEGLLVLLRHKFLRGMFLCIGVAQHGHRDNLLARATLRRMRSVAIEFGTGHWVRNGGASGSVTVGNRKTRPELD